jgi:hypothetical protein
MASGGLFGIGRVAQGRLKSQSRRKLVPGATVKQSACVTLVPLQEERGVLRNAPISHALDPFDFHRPPARHDTPQGLIGPDTSPGGLTPARNCRLRPRVLAGMSCRAVALITRPRDYPPYQRS